MKKRTPAQRIRDSVRTPKATGKEKKLKPIDEPLHNFLRWIEKRKKDK